MNGKEIDFRVASRNWTMRLREWAMIYSQLMIFVEDRGTSMNDGINGFTEKTFHSPSLFWKGIKKDHSIYTHLDLVGTDLR